MRIGLVVPHIFMHREILPEVIFSSGRLAIELAEGLEKSGADVTLFSPGPIDTVVKNEVADLSFFEEELKRRKDTYIDLLKKHPLTFISLARQVQAELISRAFEMANNDELDVVHIYTNEEDIALPFAQFCKKPVVFTHHDPFNFLVRYRNVFPKFKHLNWISMSFAQRATMPENTNWVGNIYHGMRPEQMARKKSKRSRYIAYMGRIIHPKGVHLAIEAVKLHNATSISEPYQLRIAGKHYSGHSKDSYWHDHIEPMIDQKEIVYEGYISKDVDKQVFLSRASALVIPSIFEEPFGMVMIEALACGTPLIGLDSGAISEIIKDGETGFIVKKSHRSDATGENQLDTSAITKRISDVIEKIGTIRHAACRKDFETRFTISRMCAEHLSVYRSLMGSSKG